MGGGVALERVGIRFPSVLPVITSSADKSSRQCSEWLLFGPTLAAHRSSARVSLFASVKNKL